MASRFALVFLLLISAQRGEFKKPMCPPIASERRLLSTKPSVFSEVGGDPLDIRVDCLTNDEVAATNAVCRFFSGDRFVDVPGFINTCEQIYCTTPPFTTISCVRFHVSVDGTKTFPFKGNVYVLSQEDLPAKVKVFQPFMPWRKIDFSMEEKITVIWPWDNLDNVETVSIYIQVVTAGFGRRQNFLWSSDIEITKHLENAGNFEFLPSEIPRQSLDTLKLFGLTLGVIRVKADYDYDFQALSSEYLIVTSPSKCSDWVNELQSYTGNFGTFNRCPCTYEQAGVDGNFTAISHVDPPCFRSAVGSMGARQDCCYSEEGNILNEPFVGGTADAHAPGSTAGTMLHLWYDVLPSMYYELNYECGTYHKHRAFNGCTFYQPPGSAQPVSNRASWLRMNLHTVIVIVISVILFTFVAKSAFSLYRKLRTSKESSSGGESDSASSK